MGWNQKKHKLQLINQDKEVGFHTTFENAKKLMVNFGKGNPIRLNEQYVFFYKYDSYKKRYKLIEIRLDK